MGSLSAIESPFFHLFFKIIQVGGVTFMLTFLPFKYSSGWSHHIGIRSIIGKLSGFSMEILKVSNSPNG
jgi:hypothetical protein